MDYEQFIAEWNDAEETLLVHTSGSTGKPKPMRVEKKRMLASARITCDFLGLRPGDSALLCMPLDYIAGKMMVVRSIERGLRLCCVTPSNHPFAPIVAGDVAWDADEAFDLVAMVPSQVYCSLQVEKEKSALTRARNIIIGGGAINDDLAAALKELPNAVWSTYGMTETLSHIALRRLNGEAASEWYTPFDSVAISQNEDGCLVIDAPHVCTERLETHDIVEIHPDDITKPYGAVKRFRVKGRLDNVICSGGIKLQIEEIEAKLHPYIDVPFAICKRKDDKFGEVAVLMVERPLPTSPLWEEKQKSTLQTICRNVLDRYSQPKDIVFVDKISMTETGKIRRIEN